MELTELQETEAFIKLWNEQHPGGSVVEMVMELRRANIEWEKKVLELQLKK